MLITREMMARTIWALGAGVLLVPASAFGDVLSDNMENTTLGTEQATPARWLAASFGTGASAHTLHAVTLLLGNSSAGTTRAMVYTSGGLEPGDPVGVLTPPSRFGTTPESARFTTSGIALTANTTYWIVLAPEGGAFEWAWTDDNSGSGVGFQNTWAISDQAEAAGEFWWSQDIYPVQMSVVVDEPVCMADFNTDGTLNSQDFFDYLAAFFNGEARADFNADTVVNSQDFFDFLTAFFGGC